MKKAGLPTGISWLVSGVFQVKPSGEFMSGFGDWAATYILKV
jgi:hypothetical protein